MQLKSSSPLFHALARVWLPIAIATSTFASAGCDSNEDHEEVADASVAADGATHHAADAGDTADGAAPVGDRRIPFTPANDRAFVDFFVEHHRMAVDMAKHEVQHGEHAEVKAIAQQMIDVQSAEIEQMEGIAAELADSALPAMPPDPHSDADMDHMETVHGAELDAMFLTEMITHHASGLPVAHRSLTTLKLDSLRRLADDMIKAQASEIGKMQALREQLGVTDAGEDLAPAEAGRADMGLMGDTRISLTPADDVEFIDFFAPHHEMAIMMAEQVLANGEDATVREMAQAMRDSQSAEIATMRTVRKRLTGKEESPALEHDAHMHAEMEQMMSLRGAELDRMFLAEMVTHHAAAVPTAHRAKPHVKASEIRSMADDIFEAQSREIGELQQMLQENPMP